MEKKGGRLLTARADHTWDMCLTTVLRLQAKDIVSILLHSFSFPKVEQLPRNTNNNFMKHLLFLLVAIATVSCAQTQGKELKFPVGNTKPIAGEAVASFAEGCFWHTEIVFQSLEGVRD